MSRTNASQLMMYGLRKAGALGHNLVPTDPNLLDWLAIEKADALA